MALHYPTQSGPGGSVGRVIYLVSMPDGTLQRSYGKVFDQVRRVRPAPSDLPRVLVDLACNLAGLMPRRAGTRDRLWNRTADPQPPGSGLARHGGRAGRSAGGARPAAASRHGELELVNARLEDAASPTSISGLSSRPPRSIGSIPMWAGSGRRRARARREPRSPVLRTGRSAQRRRPAGTLSAMTAIAPEIASDLAAYRDLATTLTGVASPARTSRRCGLGWGAMRSRASTRPICSMTRRSPQCRRCWSTPPTNSMLCLARCRSGHDSRLSNAKRWRARIGPCAEQLGRPIRSSIVACLVTARLGDSK